MDNYSEAIMIAEKAVEKIVDPKLKIEAFKTVLEDLLKKKETKSNPQNTEELVVQKKVEGFKKKLLDRLKISEGELSMIYRIEGDEFEICCRFEENGKWQQIQYVFIYLLANLIKTGERRLLLGEVLSSMKAKGFGELPNLNAFLRELDPKYIYVKTFEKKTKNFLELTLNGISASEKMVNAIIENSGVALSNLRDLFGFDKTRRKGKPGKNSNSPLTNSIQKMIDGGEFKNPISIKKIKEKLDELGKIYDRNIIDEKIRRVFLGKGLRRIRDEKKWKYLKNGD